MRHDFTKGLTPFVCWMLRATPEQLSRDPRIIAEHFGINNVAHVRGYLRLHGGEER